MRMDGMDWNDPLDVAFVIFCLVISGVLILALSSVLL